MEISELLKQKVEEMQLKSVKFIEHAPIFNVEEGVKAIGINYNQGVSTLIVNTEKGYFGVYRSDCMKIVTSKLKKLIGVTSLNFASAQEIKEKFGFTVGAVGVYHPDLTYYMDKSLFNEERVYGGTGLPTLDISIIPNELQLLTSAKVGDFTELSESRTLKKRILTGDRPTGKLHIGHMFGSLLNRAKLQEEYEEYVLIANIQALTDNFNSPEKVSQNILELLCDYYATGIDFNKVTICIQSEIPEIHELFIYLSNFATVQQIQHNPTIKTEMQQKDMEISTPLGFFIYPIHQAADILCVNADLVPVGRDQAPMIEDTREIARKFNKTYGVNILNYPSAMIADDISCRVPGIDGNSKMGKSLNNCIHLADSSEEVKAKVKKIYTDPGRIHATDPGKIEGNVAFIYHDLFNENIDEVNDLKERYKKGTVGDVEVKDKLYLAIEKKISPIREKRKEAEGQKDELLEKALEGSKKVRKIARGIADQMKEAMKIKF